MRWILFGLIFLPQMVLASLVPTVNVQVSPTKGDLETRFLLDASLSRNNNGLRDGLQFKFKPSRNDRTSGWLSTPQFYFYPEKTGNFQAQIWVRDRQGNENTSYVKYRVTQESFRNVRLTLSNPSPASGEAVKLEVIITSAQEKDKDQAQVRWDFTSDGKFDTNFSISKSTYHVYTGGTTSPTAEVRFPDGKVMSVRGFEVIGESYRSRTPRSAWPKIKSQPLSPKAPVVEVSPGNEVFNESTIFTFDASKTQVSGWIEWSIDGVRLIEREKKIQHKFLSPGVHQIRVRNCKNVQSPQCAETTLEVKINPLPTDALLNFYVTNLTDPSVQHYQQNFLQVTQGDRIRFNAQILNNFDSRQRWQYRWDFDGNGVWDTTFSANLSAEHTFDRDGTYQVKLEARPVKTSKHLESIFKSKSIIVYRNQAPKGKIWFRKFENYTKERVYFEAILGDRNSEDNVEIRVDSDGDGVWDSDFARRTTWWWIYDEPGKYNIKMQVRDPQKKVYETRRTIEILPVPNPGIKVKVSHRTQEIGKNILFDASETNGLDLSYEWKVQGNPYIWARGNRVNFKFDKPGNYVVCLRVIDREARVQEVNIPVTASKDPVVIKPSGNTAKAASSHPLLNTSNSGSPVSEDDASLRFMGVNMPKGVHLTGQTDPFAVTSEYNPSTSPVLTGMRPGW